MLNEVYLGLMRKVGAFCEYKGMGFGDISQLPNLIRGLEELGWSASEIDKVLGGNWMRVYERIWGA